MATDHGESDDSTLASQIRCDQLVDIANAIDSGCYYCRRLGQSLGWSFAENPTGSGTVEGPGYD